MLCKERRKKNTRKELNEIIRICRDVEVEESLNPISDEARNEVIRKEVLSTLDDGVLLGCKFSSSMEVLVDLFSKMDNKELGERSRSDMSIRCCPFFSLCSDISIYARRSFNGIIRVWGADI